MYGRAGIHARGAGVYGGVQCVQETEGGLGVVQAANLADFADTDRVVVDLSDISVLVVRCDRQFYAFENVCPHAGAALETGSIEGRRIECSVHGWTFDVASGRRVQSWWDRLASSSTPCRLRTFPVVVQGDAVRGDLGAPAPAVSR